MIAIASILALVSLHPFPQASLLESAWCLGLSAAAVWRRCWLQLLIQIAELGLECKQGSLNPQGRDPTGEQVRGCLLKDLGVWHFDHALIAAALAFGSAGT